MRLRTTTLARLSFCSLLLSVAAALHAQPAALSDEQAEKLVNDAIALYRSGDSKTALVNLERALAHYQGSGDRESESSVLYAQGIVVAKTGAHAKALESFAKALTIDSERGDEEGVAATLREQAASQIALRQFEQAIQSFEQERALNVRLADRKAEAESLHNLGAIKGAALGRAEEGLLSIRQALAIRREIGDREGEARELKDQAFLLRRLEQPEQAVTSYEQSLQIWQSLGDVEEIDEIQAELTRLRAAATVHKPPTAKQLSQADKAHEANNECIDLMRAGAHENAVPKCERAVELFRLAGDPGGESMALANRAFLDFAQGEYAKAMELAQRALALARETGSEEAQGNPLNQMGLVYLAWAQYPQALTAFQRVLAIQRKVHDLPGERRTLNNIAGLHVALGQYAQAAEIWQKLLPQQRGAQRAEVLLNLGVVHAQRKELPKALELFQEALALQRQSGDPLVRATLASMAAAYAELSEYDNARQLLDEALVLDRAKGDRLSESGALGQVAYIQSRKGEPDNALKSYQRSLALAREIELPTAQSHALAGIGRVLEEQGRPEQALDAYLQSIAIEEAIRTAGQTEEMKSSLGERSADVYQRAVRLLVRSGKRTEAFELAERARARTFLDQLGNTRIDVKPGGAENAGTRERELRLAWVGLEHLLQQERTRPRAEQDAQRIRSLTERLRAKREEYSQELLRLKSANPEYASLVSVAPLQLAELQKLLEADATLVSYFVTPGETLAFVVTRDGLEIASIPVSDSELSAAVEELRDFRSVGRELPPSLARLSAWLVAPVQPLLKTPLVGIVPHGVLHLLPFAALSASDGYLADKYTLFHLPTASALPFIQQKRKTVQGELLVLAQAQAEGLPPLRHAEPEAAAIAALYGASAIVGGQATEQALRAGAGNAGILHIAAHGQLNSASPLFSRVVLAPDNTLDASLDGSLEVREIYGLSLKKASLVVLSACQTQLGARTAGDDIVGLSRAFIYAGAPTVIASLWSVDDVATSNLMTAFHRNIRQGQGKAAALRAAQAEVRAKHPDPFYWAAFVLTGDPK